MEEKIMNTMNETVNVKRGLSADNIKTIGVASGLVAVGFVGKWIIDKIQPFKRIGGLRKKLAEEKAPVDTTATITDIDSVPKAETTKK